MNFEKKYPIVEHFNTLQGEGFYAGNNANFIRLGGCDVGCVWCDTKESWDANAHQQYTIHEIVNWVKSTPAKLVVITGGEPLMHDLDDLTVALASENILCNIETSGTHSFSGKWNWVCLSPKKFKPVVAENYQYANELKVVVFNETDLKWAIQEAMKVGANCMLYLQPEWSKKEEMSLLIADFIKQNPRWKMSVQVHKYLNIP